MGLDDPAVVEGYAGRLSHAPGDVATLHLAATRPGLLGDVVPADTELAVDVEIARVGATRDVVHRASGLLVAPRDIPEDASAFGARWPVTLEVPVGTDWASGWYEVTLTSTPPGGGPPRRTHAGFAVRPDAAAAAAAPLLVLATNTWNAYNDWGGTNLYTGGTHVAFARPFARGFLDRPDPFTHRNANTADEPDPDVDAWIFYVFDARVSPWSACAGWPNWEAMFVRWAEVAGYRLDVATNADLAEHPELLDGRRLLLSVGHDEYWSWEMRDAVEGFADGGGNVAFLSGNTAFWQVRLEDGTGGPHMVGYKMAARADDPVVGTPHQPRLTSMWSDPWTGRPETTMTGVSFTRGGYARIGGGTPRGQRGYTVWRPDHWLFAGTDLRYGDVLGAEHVVVGYECDGCALTLVDGRPAPTGEDGCPAGFEVLASAPARLWSMDATTDEYPAGLAAMRSTGELQEAAALLFGDDRPEHVARIAHGHAVLGSYRREGGGTVVTTGCTDWAYGLAGGDPMVDRVTRNVLDGLAR